MSVIREYVFPQSVEEALGILAGNRGKARIISGGTDLMSDLARETVEAEVLADVTRIAGFDEIGFAEGRVIIGAAVTMSALAANARIRANVSSLAQAAEAVGAVQIRNIATLTGNIVRAQPAADTAVMLCALGASLTVCGTGGVRDIPVQEAYVRAGVSAVDATREVVSKIEFREPAAHQGSSFVRLAQRKALALPMLNVGVMLSLSGGAIEWARIVMAPVGIKPVRAKEAESFLTGRAPDAQVFKEAGALAVQDANPRSSLVRGSREYRLAVLPALVERALSEAANEIAAKGGM